MQNKSVVKIGFILSLCVFSLMLALALFPYVYVNFLLLFSITAFTLTIISVVVAIVEVKTHERIAGLTITLSIVNMALMLYVLQLL
jgi:uncharacterized membrane protein